MAVRHTWGEDRVFFFADDGTQQSLPRAWTDAADVDAFVVLAAGRSPFRVVDLLLLTELIDGFRHSRSDGDCKGDSAANVSGIMPGKIWNGGVSHQ